MWKLRAFRAAIVDAVFATLGLIPAWFFPEHAEKVAIILGIWQVPIVMYVVGPLVEAKAAKSLRETGLLK
jgi:hypothetical protein